MQEELVQRKRPRLHAEKSSFSDKYVIPKDGFQTPIVLIKFSTGLASQMGNRHGDF
jgi:hypothetical protein